MKTNGGVEAYKDFRNFLFMIWKHLGLPPPTPVQYDIANKLQHGPRRQQISAFRGVGKSYITVAYCAWRLKRDPQIKIMVVSASKERADAFSIFLKSLINDVPCLIHLKARREQRDSNVAFDVGPATPSGSPSVKSVGITGQLTGSRADLIVADDIEIPSNSATNDQREKLANLVKEFSAVIKPNGKIVYLGTPQTEMSLYNRLETRGYQMTIWCAEYPNEQQIAYYGSRLGDYIRDTMESHLAGTTVDPARFTDQDLLERKLDYGTSGYALQFMLDTSLSDGLKYPLRINDLVVMNFDIDKAPAQIKWTNNPLNVLKSLPTVAMAGEEFYSNEIFQADYLPFTSSVMTIDPSGRGKDETAYTIGKMLNGNIFCHDIGGFNDGYTDTTLKALCEIAKKYQVNTILIESNFGDGMFAELLKPHLNKIYPCRIEEVRSNTQKEVRIIDILEPVMNQHRLVINPKIIEKDYTTAKDKYQPDEAPYYMLFYQLSRISKDRGSLKHDDRLDSFAMMVDYFKKAMSLDQKDQEERRKEKLLDEELARFVKEMGGFQSGTRNFERYHLSGRNKRHSK